MPVVKLRVTYKDERVIDVIACPQSQMDTEEKFGGLTDAVRMRALYYMSWRALFWAGREPADWDTYKASILDVDDNPELRDEDVDPTPAAPPTTTSPDLPSPPASAPAS